MRLRTLALGFIVAALTASCSSGDQAGGTEPDAKWTVPCEKTDTGAAATDFKDFTLECLSDGEEHPLGRLDKRPMVITLWATWCGPCRAEAPAFKKFHAAFEDEVNLVGVDTQDDPDAGRAFAADAGWRFPSVSDPEGSVMRTQGITALPATFFVDADGKTVATFNEGELTAEALEQAASEHFGVRP